MSQINSYISGTGGAPIESITPSAGIVVVPNGAGNIDILGTLPIVTTGTANTLTISVNTATTTTVGVVELATSAETITGTDATRAVVPSGLTAKLGTQTANGVAYGAGTSSALGWTGAGSNGQVLLAATAGAPAFATLTSTDGSIVFTTGANSLDLSTSGANLLTYTSVATTPYVVLAADEYLSVDSSGGAITVQLPNAPATGRVFIIKDRTGSAATNNITVTTVGGAVNIDGATTFVMNTNLQAIQVIFSGSAYEVW